MKKGWEIKRLPEIAQYFIGLTYSPKDVSNAGTIVLRSSNIQNDELDLTDLVRVTCAVKESLHVRTGDILMCSRNGSKRLVGKTAIIGDLAEEMTFGTFMTVIRSDLNPYLSWFFRSDTFRDQIGVGENTMINQITKYMLDAISVPVPPLPEQRRIVGLLDEAFAGLATAQANAETNLQNARALFESDLQAVFSQRGKGWVEKRLGELCQIKTGKKDVNQGNPEGQYPFFTCAAEHTYSDVYSFDTEALLVAGNGNVGQVSYYSGKFEAYQRTYVLFDFKEVSAKYLYRVLDKRLSATVSKQKLGNTMPYIKIGMLTDFPVPIPPPAEQERLTAQLDALSAETSRLASIYERKLAALAALKKSLLHQAFSGEL